jgi:hypothetical protein
MGYMWDWKRVDYLVCLGKIKNPAIMRSFVAPPSGLEPETL